MALSLPGCETWNLQESLNFVKVAALEVCSLHRDITLQSPDILYVLLQMLQKNKKLQRKSMNLLAVMNDAKFNITDINIDDEEEDAVGSAEEKEYEKALSNTIDGSVIVVTSDRRVRNFTIVYFMDFYGINAVYLKPGEEECWLQNTALGNTLWTTGCNWNTVFTDIVINSSHTGSLHFVTDIDTLWPCDKILTLLV